MVERTPNSHAVVENTNAEQISDYYAKMGVSVDYLNEGKPTDMSDIDWNFVASAHVAWLQSMVDKDFWTTEDMSAVNAAITSNQT